MLGTTEMDSTQITSCGLLHTWNQYPTTEACCLIAVCDRQPPLRAVRERAAQSAASERTAEIKSLPKSGSLDLTATNYWTGWVGMRLAVSKLKIDSIRPIYDRNGTFGTPLHAQTTIYPSGLP